MFIIGFAIKCEWRHYRNSNKRIAKEARSREDVCIKWYEQVQTVCFCEQDKRQAEKKHRKVESVNGVISCETNSGSNSIEEDGQSGGRGS